MTISLVLRQADPPRLLLFMASLGLAVVVGLAPIHLLTPLLVTAALGVTVALEPKYAYFLLPVTIPFGSLLPLAGAVTPSDVVVVALLATWLVRAVARGTTKIVWNAWLLSLVAVILTMTVSLWDAQSLSASSRELVKWCEVLVTAVLAPVYLRSRTDVLAVIYITIGSAVAAAIVGLGQVFLHAGPRSFVFRGRFPRAFSTFGQPNPFAGYLNMILPLTLAMAWLKRRAAILCAAAILIGAASAATISRAGWVAGALAVLAVFLVLCRPARVAIMVMFTAALAVVSLMTEGIISIRPLTRMATSLGITRVNFSRHTHANFSEIERAAHWLAGLRMFATHPITGVGIGNYSVAYPAYHVGEFTAPLGHAHNYFINIAAEAGILGLLAYVAFVLMGILTASRLVKLHGPTTLTGAVALGAIGLWVSSQVHSMFDVLYVHELTLLPALLMGAAVACAHLSAERDPGQGSTTGPALVKAT